MGVLPNIQAKRYGQPTHAQISVEILLKIIQILFKPNLTDTKQYRGLYYNQPQNWTLLLCYLFLNCYLTMF